MPVRPLRYRVSSVCQIFKARFQLGSMYSVTRKKLWWFKRCMGMGYLRIDLLFNSSSWTMENLWYSFFAGLTPRLQTFITWRCHKLDQFWWQNHDLKWILCLKKHLKLFGVPYTWRAGPQKSQLLASGTPNVYIYREPQYSARWRILKENNVLL